MRNWPAITVPPFSRPYKPQDKAKTEVAVQVEEHWIVARLRHQTFPRLILFHNAHRLPLRGESIRRLSPKTIPDF
uniref:Transposase n=1 Tax=Candidatus Kentrum sp. MB TaxID=2138164 RepID=A0A450XT67_9GAMM|nr:MAG: hypothetical protein BECKMB1821G_GA0114241_102016 [Candidatus Kentron sp. MB]VFK32452.1 MAG: hypothetical protein BECKMB1821I_GA0114274_103327 [Candidatus Kentron sp. MB]VFK75917.1 MAG: hypothetical protein BECKMB1821H_GA0114242_103527 [Candidatus Kentron sp. MB]